MNSHLPERGRRSKTPRTPDSPELQEMPPVLAGSEMLQQSLGNAAVGRMLEGGAPEAGPAMGRIGGRGAIPPLPNGNAGRMALNSDMLMTLQGTMGNAFVQRLASSEPVQRKAEAPDEGETLRQVQRAQTGGSPLPERTRSDMEETVGHDLSDVRIHNDVSADQLSRNLNATAFTTGRDVFFRSGAYDPESAAGRETLAHELTHVAQQAGKGTAPSRAISDPSDAAEHEAESVAGRVGSGQRGRSQTATPHDHAHADAGPPTVARSAHSAADEAHAGGEISDEPIGAEPIQALTDEEQLAAAGVGGAPGAGAAVGAAGEGSAPAKGQPGATADGQPRIDPETGMPVLQDENAIQKKADGLPVVQRDEPKGQGAPPSGQGGQAQGGNTDVADLKKQVDILKKRQSATDIDSRWRASFGERMSSYKQAVMMISGGIDGANQGFASAQQAQAQQDAIWQQLVAGAFTVMLAGGMEWILSSSLGALGKSADDIKTGVEALENPANAAVSGVANAGASAAGRSTSQAGQPTGGAPGVGTTGAMAFLTTNLGALEAHTQEIEAAFAARASSFINAPDEAWDSFDPRAQETKYKALMDKLTAEAKGVETLKSAGEIATIFERWMWAKWLPTKAGTTPGGIAPSATVIDIGSDIEDRLNAVGISGLAGVTLTGHWYSPNSPRDWGQKLWNWTGSYSEKITK